MKMSSLEFPIPASLESDVELSSDCHNSPRHCSCCNPALMSTLNRKSESHRGFSEARYVDRSRVLISHIIITDKLMTIRNRYLRVLQNSLLKTFLPMRRQEQCSGARRCNAQAPIRRLRFRISAKASHFADPWTRRHLVYDWENPLLMEEADQRSHECLRKTLRESMGQRMAFIYKL